MTTILAICLLATWTIILAYALDRSARRRKDAHLRARNRERNREFLRKDLGKLNR